MIYNLKIMKKKIKYLLVVFFWVKNGNFILMKMVIRFVVGGFLIFIEKFVMFSEVDFFFFRLIDGVFLIMLVIFIRLGLMS